VSGVCAEAERRQAVWRAWKCGGSQAMGLLLYGRTGRQALLALDEVFLRKRVHVFTCCSLVVVRCCGGLRGVAARLRGVLGASDRLSCRDEGSLKRDLRPVSRVISGCLYERVCEVCEVVQEGGRRCVCRKSRETRSLHSTVVVNKSHCSLTRLFGSKVGVARSFQAAEAAGCLFSWYSS
jgi:hypothetical protein